MAISLLKLLSKAKTRTLVLLTSAILGTGIIIAIVNSGKSGEPLENRLSKTTQVPTGVESTPGAKTSEKYRELQEKANVIGAKNAAKKGGTFIPTIVANNKTKNSEELQSQFLKSLEQNDPSKAKDHCQFQKSLEPNNLSKAQDPKLAALIAQDPKYAQMLVQDMSPKQLGQLLAQDPKLAALIAQDPKYAQMLVQDMSPKQLGQLIAQDPKLAALIAQDPKYAQILVQDMSPVQLDQLLAQDPKLAALIAQDPKYAQMLAKHDPRLAALLAQDPKYAQMLAQKMSPELLNQLIAHDPKLAALIAQDPKYTQMLAQDISPELLNQLIAHDPKLAALITQDPKYAQMLAQDISPELFNQLIAHDPKLVALIAQDSKYAKFFPSDSDQNVALNSKFGQDPRFAELLAQQKQQEKAATEALKKQRQTQLSAEQMAAINEQRVKAIETVSQAMEEQTKGTFTAWNEVPAQGFVEGSLKNSSKDGSTTTDKNQENSSSKVDNRPVVVKAGTILFAVLETAVNSDEPGPIMAKIIQPPFKNAKLIGTIEALGDNAEKVTLRFNTLTIATEPASTKIDAVAIDPDTARTALASAVNHHYFLKYGAAFGAAFLKGYAQAIASSGTSSTTTIVSGAAQTNNSNPVLSGKQQVYSGLSQVGTVIGSAIDQQTSRKPTITIKSGTGVGILVLTDVKLGPEPKAETEPTTNTNVPQQKAGGSEMLNTIVKNAAQVSNLEKQAAKLLPPGTNTTTTTN